MERIYDRNIGLEWYLYGLEKADDFFIKFMMHWVAFNWLYGNYEGRRESDRIRNFCNSNLSALARYDPFSTQEYSVFLIKPIINGRTGNADYLQRERYKRMKNLQSIPDLIETIYQVRCNLFHGSKSIHNKRDIELVRASAVILEGFLKAYFSN